MIQATGVMRWWRLAVWGGAALLLSLPAIAMSWFPEAGVNWSGSDFVVMGVMLFIACVAVEIGALIGCDFGDYLNIRAWLGRMKQLKSWPQVNAVFEGAVAGNAGKNFVRV